MRISIVSLLIFLFLRNFAKKKNILARDPAEIERSNLVNICKLVVKELLEQSVRYGRMLDSDHLPLQHFFIVIEHVLGHGLRTKKVKINGIYIATTEWTTTTTKIKLLLLI